MYAAPPSPFPPKNNLVGLPWSGKKSEEMSFRLGKKKLWDFVTGKDLKKSEKSQNLQQSSENILCSAKREQLSHSVKIINAQKYSSLS